MTSVPVPVRVLAAALATVLTVVLVLAVDAWRPPPGDAAPAVPAAVSDRGGEGCLVPELRGFRLRVAQAELEWANCRLGRVRTRHAAPLKRGLVIEQQYYAGTQLSRRHRVGVTLGR
ncbi:MAG: hypothetical protein H6529_08040 [Nocardioides sp.]|nr:hypothetical protein [Nocardioidaceae bacterium]MCB8956420.1 hypothetical protein [Nocardioides sp.]